MIRRTILKTPAEYAKELENYKQLKSNVAVIFKTPELERQSLIQALKLEEEGKTSAQKLISEQESTKEQDLTKVDIGLLNEINELLDAENFNIFPDRELEKIQKTGLEAIKLALLDIKRIDAGKPASQKSRYIDDSINRINRLLDGKTLNRSPRRPPGRPPSVTRPSMSTSKSVGAVDGPSVATSIPAVKKPKYNVPKDFLPIINADAFKATAKQYEDLDDDTLKNYLTNIEESLKFIRKTENKNKLNKLDPSTFTNIQTMLTTRRTALNNLLGVATIGQGLSKSKPKSKSKSKPKSNLGAQQQIYYILSQKSGNNNKLMKKRLAKK